MNIDETRSNRELRSEIREAASKGASVEFKPAKESMTYHFSLRDWSPSGLGILIQKDSDILGFIEVGQEILLKFHKGDATLAPEQLKARIRHISDPAGGRHPNHLIVGLHILERISK
ncbi:MAG: hypothetical protein MI863_27495 [Desulfobacterales bacterium]|nr:hypothetical protein [Desulfobacterales bacterium]